MCGLTHEQPGPERAQHHLEERDQRHLMRRQPGECTHHQPAWQRELKRTKERKDEKIASTRGKRPGERQHGCARDQGAQQHRRREIEFGVNPSEGDQIDGRGERYAQRDKNAREAIDRYRLVHHPPDTRAGCDDRRPGDAADGLAQHDAGKQRGEERRQPDHQKRVGDAGPRERDHEAGEHHRPHQAGEQARPTHSEHCADRPAALLHSQDQQHGDGAKQTAPEAQFEPAGVFQHAGERAGAAPEHGAAHHQPRGATG